MQELIQGKITKKLFDETSTTKLLSIVIGASVVLGVITGIVIAGTNGKSRSSVSGIPEAKPKTAQADTQTFRDFAEGVIQPKPTPKKANEYTEGTHILKRENADSVTLTSSVVDLSTYEGKKVKVFGETQKALKAGWLMDVGKVEEIK